VNPLLLYFASGESLYPGAVLVLVTVVTSQCTRRRWLNPLLNIAAWLGLVMMVMACPPFGWSVDAIFGASFLLWLVEKSSTSQNRIRRRLRKISVSVLFVLLVALTTVEFLHRREPSLRGEASDHLVVIGDSISAGLGTRARSWPDVMHEATGVTVKNLSWAGATVADGMVLVGRVGPDDHVVLIELGGNDLLGGEAPEVFSRGLEALLAKLAAPERSLVMFELPLLPPDVAYGRIQRRLAAKYGVSLIPKRFLIQVISGSDATFDGLHLTDVGARRMTSVVVPILSPILKTKFPATVPATHP